MPYKDAVQYAADGVGVIDGEHIQGTISNRPHDQLITNTDYLASVGNADRNLRITGGGWMEWDSATRTLIWTERIYITCVNEQVSAGVGGAYEHHITAGSLNFGAAHEILYIRLDRRTNRTGGSSYTGANLFSCANAQALKVLLEAHATQEDRFQYVIFATRERDAIGGPNDYLTLWDGRFLRSGPENAIALGREYQYAQQSEYAGLNSRNNQDRTMILSGGGILTWASGPERLSNSEDLVLLSPSDNTHTIFAGNFPLLPAAWCYYITLDRSDGAGIGVPAGAVSTAAVGALDKSDDNLFVLAYRDPTDPANHRLILCDGTVIDFGASAVLGGLAQGVRWVYTGAGTGAAGFDIEAELLGGNGQVVPLGTTPNYRVGGGELFVWVNGILRSEGRFRSQGGATTEDYDEAALALGEQSTEIMWTAGHIPDADDKIIAAVGLVNPNLFGPLPLLTAADSAGTPIGTVPLQDAQIREDAAAPNQTIILATGADPAGNYLDVSVGGYIADPVRGRRAGGPVTEGALSVYSHRPTLFHNPNLASEFLSISPGELALPLSPAPRDPWVVCRNDVPVTINVSDPANRRGDGSLPAAYPAPFYVYAYPLGISHDSGFGIYIDPRPPVVDIAAPGDWHHPGGGDAAMYVGSVVCTSVGGVFPEGIVPFDRCGSKILFRPHHRTSNWLWDFAGAPGAVPDLATVVPLPNITQALPITVTGAILSGYFSYNIDDHIFFGGGVAEVGVTFFSGNTGPTVGFSNPIADDQDCFNIYFPINFMAVAPSQTFLFNSTVPLCDHVGGEPVAPLVGAVVSDYWLGLVAILYGYEENEAVYRHGFM